MSTFSVSGLHFFSGGSEHMVDAATLLLILFPALCFILPFAIPRLKRAFSKHRRPERPRREITQQFLIDHCKAVGGANTVTRNLCTTCHDLDTLDRNAPLTRKEPRISRDNYFTCYSCEVQTSRIHPVYVFCCRACGNRFQHLRTFSTDLTSQVSVVVGCRTEFGHQVTLKLLRAGSRVVGTSRQPARAVDLFRRYGDSDRWLANLDVYERPLDFSLPQMREPFAEFAAYIAEKHSFVTNIVFCAGQSVTPAERIDRKPILFNGSELNRYGDLQFARSNWDQTIYDVRQDECERSMRVNGVAPALFFQALFPLMRRAPTVPFFVSAHAYEGLFTVPQNAKHIHANMGKTTRAMLTRCLPEHKMTTDSGLPFAIHGVDPGCFSVDEYSEGDRTWIIPPLDEVDAAARMLYPIFMKLKSAKKTRRNFTELLY